MIPPYVTAGGAASPRPTTGAASASELARGAEAAAPHGLTVAWHNHDFEYAPAARRHPAHRPHPRRRRRRCKFEIDCGWIVRGGADPAAELERYADRIVAIQTQGHRAARAPPTDDGWTATGDGIIDWAALVPLFRATKADHIVTEHDNPATGSRFAQRSINHLKRV